MSQKNRNVVIVHTDEHVYSLLGCMGHDVLRTPNIDRLAEEGVLFRTAYSCSGVCVPARAGLLTGRYTISHGVTSNYLRMPPTEPLMSRLFGTEGYATGYFGKTHYGGNDTDMSADGWQESFIWHRQYNDYLSDRGIDIRYPEGSNVGGNTLRYWNAGTSRIPTEHYFENVIGDRAVDFIRRHRDDKFLCFVGNIAPHGPISPPPPYDRMYAPEDVEIFPRIEGELEKKHPAFVRWVTQNQKYINEEELRLWVRGTYGLITLVDDNVGKIVQALQAEGLYDDTLIVFTSDHGDFGSQYGIIGKSWSMIDNLMRIPFIVRCPGTPSGKQTDAFAQCVDVLPTLLEFAGLPVPHKVQGRSLLPILRGQSESVRDAVFGYDQSEYSEDSCYMSMVRRGPWKLTKAHDGFAELYDVSEDPWEVRNLADEPESADVRGELQEALLRWHVQCAGGYFAKESARFWEDETAFYDEDRFCGERIRPRGDSPV